MFWRSVLRLLPQILNLVPPFHVKIYTKLLSYFTWTHYKLRTHVLFAKSKLTHLWRSFDRKRFIGAKNWYAFTIVLFIKTDDCQIKVSCMEFDHNVRQKSIYNRVKINRFISFLCASCITAHYGQMSDEKNTVQVWASSRLFLQVLLIYFSNPIARDYLPFRTC